MSVGHRFKGIFQGKNRENPPALQVSLQGHPHHKHTDQLCMLGHRPSTPWTNYMTTSSPEISIMPWLLNTKLRHQTFFFTSIRDLRWKKHALKWHVGVQQRFQEKTPKLWGVGTACLVEGTCSSPPGPPVYPVQGVWCPGSDSTAGVLECVTSILFSDHYAIQLLYCSYSEVVKVHARFHQRSVNSSNLPFSQSETAQLAYLAKQISQSLPLHFSTFLSSS